MKAYQMKITLRDVKPPVWRRVIVPQCLTFAQFKEVALCAMGWLGGHLYAFRFPADGLYISETFDEVFSAEKVIFHSPRENEIDASRTVLAGLLSEGKKFYMDYDFGDGWEHSIQVEKILEDYPFDYPQVVKYKGDCPPEDVGGPWGYANFLEIINDPENPERDEMLSWADSQLYKEYDMQFVNEDLRLIAERDYRGFFGSDDGYTETRADFEYLIQKRKPVHDIASLLNSLTVTVLRMSASEMDIRGYSSMKKAELVQEIYSKWMEGNPFYGMANHGILEPDEVQFLNDIMMSEDVCFIAEEAIPYSAATLLMALFLVTAYREGDQVGFIAVDEARTKYMEFMKDVRGVFDSVEDELDTYARAAANLYGAISLSEFAEIYRSQTGSEFSNEEILESLLVLIDEYENSEAEYEIKSDVIISDMIKDWGMHEIKQLLKVSKNHPQNILAKEDFLKYEDWLFYEETEAHLRFCEFLARKLGEKNDDVGKAPMIVGAICGLIRQWAPFQEVFDALNEEGITLDTKEEAKQVSEMISIINNHTRIWGNNGSTPAELGRHASYGVPYRNAETRIGRNEPCPCGSGKKYKNCCGRVMN